MNVHVEHAGNHVMATGVDDFGTLCVECDAERGDLFVANADVAVEGAGGCHDVPGGDDGVESHFLCVILMRA